MKLRVIGTGMLAAVLAVAVGRPAIGDDRKDDKPFDDKEFVQLVSSSGIREVKIGEVAKTKAANDLVKKFAEKMVTDHTKVNEEMAKIAQALALTGTDKMNEKDQKEFDHLNGLSGSEFDKAYMDHMVKGHEKSVKLFKRAGTEAKNAQLKELATKTLPTIEEHLKMAKEVQQQVSK
jgi:putative membrane protein